MKEAIVTKAGHYPLYHMPPTPIKFVPIPCGSRVTVRHPAADQDGYNVPETCTVCEIMRHVLVVIPTANLEEVLV
jgi:hypothetical protein